MKNSSSLLKKNVLKRVNWCLIIYYRGYILVRLKIIGTQWTITEKLRNFHPEYGKKWKITYVSPVYGGWDLIVECAFTNLDDLDEIVSYCRTDPELSEWIEATITLIGTEKNYTV